MKLTLVQKREAAPNCFTFTFQSDTPLEWKAGQYLRYHLEDPGPDERGTNRYFSISAAPFEKQISLTTRFAPENGSTFKKDLFNLPVGGVLEATGPIGSFVLDTTQVQANQKYVFIAGGIGITPFRAILLDLDFNNLPMNITLFYANRDQNIVFKDELDNLALKHPEFKINYVMDPQRVDANLLKTTLPDYQTYLYYVSGPEPMVQGIEKILAEELQIPEDHQKRDYFPGYTWPAK